MTITITRERLAEWLPELRDAGKLNETDQAALADALAADPRHLAMRPDADLDAALAAALEESTDSAALAMLADRLSVRFPPARGLMDGAHDPNPCWLLREAGGRGSILARGEVTVLTGAGGRGKSTLAMQWAMAGALAMAAIGQDFGATGGLDVRAGRAMLLTYEDSARRVADRATDALTLETLKELSGANPADALNEHVRLIEARGHALFGVGEGAHALTRPGPLPAWRAAWNAVREHDADLVVLDPAMSVYAADPNAVAFVRLFLDALYSQAQEHGCGVLLLAHSTKAARRAKDADATGAVAGSAAWTDAARGVLSLDFPAREGKESDADRRKRRILRVEKANYSRRFTRTLDMRLRTIRGGGATWQRLAGFEELTANADANGGTDALAAII